jgi:hypothetical protein
MNTKTFKNIDEFNKYFEEVIRPQINTNDMIILGGGSYTHGLGTCFRFGKYKNKNVSLREACQKDPHYVVWLLNNIEGFNILREVAEYLRSIHPEQSWNIPEEKLV